MTDNKNDKKPSPIDWKNFIESKNLSLLGILKFNHLRNKKGLIHDLSFVWKVLTHRKTYNRYLDLLSKPCCTSACIRDASILYKILRPYEVGNNNGRERVNILENHYNMLSEYLRIEQFDQLGTEEGIQIISFNKTEALPDDVILSLQYNGTHRREAELTVAILKKCYIEDEQKYARERIFSIAFNLGIINNERVIKINSIQGCTPHLKEPQKEISNITKQGFGMLPKFLMLEVAFKIAEIMNIKHVLGIKKASHIYNNAHYKSKISSEDFRYDYDKQWSEFGATDFNENYYKLL